MKSQKPRSTADLEEPTLVQLVQRLVTLHVPSSRPPDRHCWITQVLFLSTYGLTIGMIGADPILEVVLQFRVQNRNTILHKHTHTHTQCNEPVVTVLK